MAGVSLSYGNARSEATPRKTLSGLRRGSAATSGPLRSIRKCRCADPSVISSTSVGYRFAQWVAAVSRTDTQLIGCAIRHVLDQLINPAPEEGAQSIQHIALDIGPVVIGHLREGHPVQTGDFSDFLDGHSSALPELEIRDSLLELES